jgi:hypothetical protein
MQRMGDFEHEVLRDILNWVGKLPDSETVGLSQRDMIEAFWAEKLPKEGGPKRVLRV